MKNCKLCSMCRNLYSPRLVKAVMQVKLSQARSMQALLQVVTEGQPLVGLARTCLPRNLPAPEFSVVTNAPCCNNPGPEF